MEKIIEEIFSSLRIGDERRHGGIQIFPLFLGKKNKIEFYMMKEVLERGLFTVKEVSESGSVNELKVINEADKPVLMLDGEELKGAKQNRILNTTILVPEKSETVIPVSCVERDRWSYKRRDFYDSGNMMPSSSRAEMKKELYNIKKNLHDDLNFRVDQGKVWKNISVMQKMARVQSSTSAMSDVFDAKREDIEEYIKDFPLSDGQVGILVVHNGKILGFDIIGRPEKFSIVYRKILKSYIMEDILNRGDEKNFISTSQVEEFFNKIKESEEVKTKSAGLGYDYRYKSKELFGTVLLYNEEMIHSSFLSLSGKEEDKKRRDDFDDKNFYSSFEQRIRRLFEDL